MLEIPWRYINLMFSFHKLWLNKLMRRFYWSVKSKWQERYYTLNVRSRGKRLVLFSRESWFRLGKHQDSITGANQNSRLVTYKNANLTLKTTEWMIYKVLSLYYLHLFPPLAAVSLLWKLWKSLLFSLSLHVCVVVFIHEKENWQCFPTFCHATVQHVLIMCCNVSRAGYVAQCITIGIHLILVKAMWPTTSQ